MMPWAFLIPFGVFAAIFLAIIFGARAWPHARRAVVLVLALSISTGVFLFFARSVRPVATSSSAVRIMPSSRSGSQIIVENSEDGNRSFSAQSGTWSARFQEWPRPTTKPVVTSGTDDAARDGRLQHGTLGGLVLSLVAIYILAKCVTKRGNALFLRAATIALMIAGIVAVVMVLS
jgi:hypothetical protein